MRSLAILLTAVLVAPVGLAEFGHEVDGVPVNIHGDPIYPYIPEDWAERHPELVQQMHEQRGIVDPVEDALPSPRNKVAGLTVFPYYPLLTAEMERLAEDHPDLVRLTSAGQSRLGLDLWLLEIANFDDPERIPLSEREVIYVDGGTHSNEYSGVYFTTEWAQFLLDEYDTNETAKWIVDNRHIFILPLVNPDGSNVMGRLNAITVNINRNFPGTWGSVPGDQWPLNWPGPYPASEPETQTVINVMQDVRPDFVQSTHCCGNLWLHPYGAEHLGHAPDWYMFTNICQNVFPDLVFNVTRVRCGETWETIYPAGGTTLDEGYAQVGASSWSYEMSGRSDIPRVGWGYPVVATDVKQQEVESWRGVMHGMLYAERYGANPVITSLHVDDRVMHATIENTGWGNITEGQLTISGQAIALPELSPGETFVWEVPATVAEGDEVPVYMTWKKRMHPDSNWGEVLFNAPVEDVEGRLYAALPPLPAPPSMGSLLPPPSEMAMLHNEPQPLDHGGEEEDAPGLGALALLAVAAAAVVLRRRR